MTKNENLKLQKVESFTKTPKSTHMLPFQQSCQLEGWSTRQR